MHFPTVIFTTTDNLSKWTFQTRPCFYQLFWNKTIRIYQAETSPDNSRKSFRWIIEYINPCLSSSISPTIYGSTSRTFLRLTPAHVVNLRCDLQLTNGYFNWIIQIGLLPTGTHTEIFAKLRSNIFKLDYSLPTATSNWIITNSAISTFNSWITTTDGYFQLDYYQLAYIQNFVLNRFKLDYLTFARTL